jgi:hypothetical protein
MFNILSYYIQHNGIFNTITCLRIWILVSDDLLHIFFEVLKFMIRHYHLFSIGSLSLIYKLECFCVTRIKYKKF